MNIFKKTLIYIISFFSLLPYRFSNRIQIGKNVIANWRLKIKIKGKGKILIGDNVNLWSHAEPTQIFTYKNSAKIVIGQGSRLNGATLQARKNIHIGKKCLLGSVIIMDNDFHHYDIKKRFIKSQIPTSEIKIGNNVWLAGRSAVLKGVKIGDNAVVAFGTIVTKDVPKNSLIAGNPAK
jgi:acetyltransferase-like isoleucine patch superfamily enzyme